MKPREIVSAQIGHRETAEIWQSGYDTGLLPCELHPKWPVPLRDSRENLAVVSPSFGKAPKPLPTRHMIPYGPRVSHRRSPVRM